MSTAIVRFEGMALHPTPDIASDWTMPTNEVAAAFGVEANAVRMAKTRHADELAEGKHWGVTVGDTLGGPQTQTVWTKRGIIRLSFLMRSPRAKAFRDFAEDLVLAVVEQHDYDALVARLVDTERRLAVLEAAAPRQGRLFALPVAQRKPVPVRANVGAVVARKAEQRTRAINAIAEPGGVRSIRQLAALLNISWSAARTIAEKLVKDGTIIAEQDIADHHNVAIALRVAS